MDAVNPGTITKAAEMIIALLSSGWVGWAMTAGLGALAFITYAWWEKKKNRMTWEQGQKKKAADQAKINVENEDTQNNWDESKSKLDKIKEKLLKKKQQDSINKPQ